MWLQGRFYNPLDFGKKADPEYGLQTGLFGRR
jgi:hypothetical protein